MKPVDRKVSTISMPSSEAILQPPMVMMPASLMARHMRVSQKSEQGKAQTPCTRCHDHHAGAGTGTADQNTLGEPAAGKPGSNRGAVTKKGLTLSGSRVPRR